MSSSVLVLAVVGLLAAAALGILAIIIIGIRKGDCGRLSSTPESHSDAFARRILVGVRYPRRESEGEDQ
jgi:hypothetical protein